MRKIAGRVEKGVAIAGTALDVGKKVANGQVKIPPAPDAAGVLQLARDGGLLNSGSDFARSKLSKQLAFLKDQKELDEVQAMISQSSLMSGVLPSF